MFLMSIRNIRDQHILRLASVRLTKLRDRRKNKMCNTCGNSSQFICARGKRVVFSLTAQSIIVMHVKMCLKKMSIK